MADPTPPGSPLQTEHVNDPRATAPWWTADHEVLLERARRLEEARTLNNATASARAILHEGKRGCVETNTTLQPRSSARPPPGPRSTRGSRPGWSGSAPQARPARHSGRCIRRKPNRPRLMGASRDEASFLAEFEPRLADIRRRTLPVAQRREFKWYCRLASHLAGDDLKNELEARARADDSVVARRARLVLGAIVRKQKPTPQD